MKKKYVDIPDNWKDMSALDKEKWFARYYLRYLREGEAVGLNDDAPESVKKAYEEFLNEEMERN